MPSHGDEHAGITWSIFPLTFHCDQCEAGLILWHIFPAIDFAADSLLFRRSKVALLVGFFERAVREFRLSAHFESELPLL